MCCKSPSIVFSLIITAISASLCLGACPSADLTGDCFVEFEDFVLLAAGWLSSDFSDVAVMAAQWLTTDPGIPDEMTYIPDGGFQMGDHHGGGSADALPVHAVLLDSFFMSKYETTNAQYCDFLNSAKSQGMISVSGLVVYKAGSGTSYPYCDIWTTSRYSISWAGGVFSVKTKSGRDMSNDPMIHVSWYGAAAYCNWRSQQEGYEACYNLSTWECDLSKNGYRLPTEAEWEYAARGGQHGPYCRFPWGDTISHSQANYSSSDDYSYDISPTRGFHPTWMWEGSPRSAPVGSLSANGYGLYDIAGNVREWCNDWHSANYYGSIPAPHINPPGPNSGTYRVVRGGSWRSYAPYCRVDYRRGYKPDESVAMYATGFGFRVVLDLN